MQSIDDIAWNVGTAWNVISYGDYLLVPQYLVTNSINTLPNRCENFSRHNLHLQFKEKRISTYPNIQSNQRDIFY